jgi:hypothetical protein
MFSLAEPIFIKKMAVPAGINLYNKFPHKLRKLKREMRHFRMLYFADKCVISQYVVMICRAEM